ncbi:MAG: ATP-dependent RNA helicase RhlE [Candidatus Azotimanducaceae bacterium]|jgi:ATP-dependent RNA helicase RhlE
MSLETLGLSAELLLAVREQGYTEPTPIQAKAIPIVLAGEDVMAAAQTGTGKTAAFTLPLLHRLTQNAEPARSGRPVRALILTPTRELAAQVAENVASYAKHLPLTSTVVFGGVNINPQTSQLRRGVDILIATPGRLLDHAGQRNVDLSKVEILVLDEADRMLDMGFIHDIRKVMALLPEKSKRQNLLFSATFSGDIKRLANGLLNSPKMVEVATQNATADKIKQTIHPVDKIRKRELLSLLIRTNNWEQVLVFTRTKHGANRLAQQLEQDGLNTAAIHGNKSQGARTKALAGFKNGTVKVLIATDIAARGLDIDQLPHVVNYELPNVPEDYVHRIGRTGRAGREGEALSLVSPDEEKLLRDIERLLNTKLPRIVPEGFKASGIAPPPEPEHRGRSNNSRGRTSNSNSRTSSASSSNNGARSSSGARSSNGARSTSGPRSSGSNAGRTANGNGNGNVNRSGNSASGNSVSGNNASGNSASGNSASGNSVSGNSASGNSVSGNRAPANSGNQRSGQSRQRSPRSANV